MSLYNDIRPKTLDQVIGQDNIKEQLKGVISGGNIPNAFLLTGPRGTGKTTIARIIARALNCENGGLDPCGECPSCKAILNGTSYDVIEMDAASNNKVEDVRGIIEKAQYAPMSKYKIFILDEVHMFSSGAWNSLLKLIEEPPVGVVFILCTTEEHKVPATIISRCRKFYFQTIDLNVISDYLGVICENYGKAYEKDALRLIAQASEGCMRDALSIMESFFDNDNLLTDVVADTLGISNEDAVFGILEAISKADSPAALKIVREQAMRGKNVQLLVKAIISAVTDTMFVINGADPSSIVNTAKYKQLLTEFSTRIDMTQCLQLSKALGEVYGMLSKAPDALFLIESSLIRVIQVESVPYFSLKKIEEMEDRIAALENGSFSADKTLSQPGRAVSSEISEITTQENIVAFPDTNGISIDSINLPISIENTSPLDIGNDIPFPEDEFYIPIDDNAHLEASEETSAEEYGMQVSTELVDAHLDIPEPPVSVDDIFSHLPKGTTVINNDIDTAITSKEETTLDVTPESNEEKTIAGEEKFAVNVDNSISAAEFESFAGWL